MILLSATAVKYAVANAKYFSATISRIGLLTASCDNKTERTVRMAVAKYQSGFTLVELVCAILIIGVLAATALPKFINMGQSARIAAVSALQGSVQSAATIASAKCRVDASCNPNVSASAIPTSSLNGTTIYFHFGYPSPMGRWGRDDNVGSIRDAMKTSGFTFRPHVSGSWAGVYTNDSAPDPTNCKVIYQMNLNGTPPVFATSAVTTGC